MCLSFLRRQSRLTVAAEARQHAAFFKAQLTGQARTAIAEGWLDQSTVDAIAEELDTWAERPDAFSALIWCEAIGWVND